MTIHIRKELVHAAGCVHRDCRAKQDLGLLLKIATVDGVRIPRSMRARVKLEQSAPFIDDMDELMNESKERRWQSRAR